MKASDGFRLGRGLFWLICFFWAALLWINYWPAFGFPPAYAVKAFLPDGPLNAAGFLKSIGSAAANLAAAVFVLAACYGAGRIISRLVVLRPASAAFVLPAGIVALGTSVLGLGLLGLINAGVLAAVTGFLALAGVRRISEWPLGVPFGFPAALILLATAVPVALVTLCPEVTYDALAYHIGAPEIYLKYRRIIRLEGMFFSDLPGLLQMVYLPAIVFAGDAGPAKMIHFFFGAASIVLAAKLGKLAGGERCAAWSLIFLAATPFLWICMMRANVDLGAMFLVTAGVIQLVSNPGLAGVMAAGFFFGGAAAAKISAGYALPAALAFIVSDRRGDRHSKRRLALFSLAAALPLLVWLVKAWSTTGNPVYPLGYGLMGGLGWSVESRDAYRKDMTGPKSFNIQYPGVWGRLAGPWRMIMHDRGGEAALGIFAITFIPFLLIFRGLLLGHVRNIAWFSLVYWLGWFFTARDARFFMPAWPTVCVLCAVVWVSLQDAAGRARPYATAPVWVAWAFTPFFISMLAWHLFNPGPVIWGRTGRGMYVNWMVPPQGKFAPMMRRASDYFSPRERILFVGDVKAVELKPIPVYSSMFDTPHLVAWVRESADSRRLAIRFRQKGIDGVFFNRAGANYLKTLFGHYRYTGGQYNVLEEFWTGRLKPLRELRASGKLELGLYRVLSRPSARTGVPIPGNP